MRKKVFSGVSSVLLVILSLNVLLFGMDKGTAQATQRLQPSDLVYMGAFRLPDGTSDVKSWQWGGYAMTYYPGGDPTGPDDGYPGSIYGAGHAWEHQVSEITIPVPVISPSKNLADLNTASTLQGFRDIFNVGQLEMPRTGLAYLPKQNLQTTGKLYLCKGQHLLGDGTFLTHGWCEPDLSNPGVQGTWYLDVPHQEYNTNDYLFDVPTDWAAANTPSEILATGRYRDGGWSGQGPSLFIIGPWNQGNPPASGTALPYTTLLRYTSTEDPESWDEATNHTMDNYLHSDEWSGASWITAGNKAAVVFVGTKGTGDCWYGNPEGPCLECDNRGWWSTGFVGRFIFYDPADLAKVAAGTIESWEPQPYATLDVDQYLYHISTSQDKEHLGAACFDRANGLFYVFEPLVDDDKPLVHVWKVNAGSGTSELPFGIFSTPENNAVVSNSVAFTGWALDDTGVKSVKIYRVDGGTSVYIGDAVFVEGARPDVAAAYPGYPMNDRAGWGYMMLTNFLPNSGNGIFTFTAVATDNEGNRVTLGTKTVTCDNADAVNPFGAIDTPGQGGIASGAAYRNHGWVLTPMPNYIPTNGSTIHVIVDGVDLGQVFYNIYRSDIAGLFPGYANSNGAAAYFDLDTGAYANGVHTIAWSAVDSAGNTDGIGSRYFTVQNTGQERKARVDASGGSPRARGRLPLDPLFKMTISESERVEVGLSAGTGEWFGYLEVGNQLGKLPVGSTLDVENGIFYWLPGPGFLGDYDFIFIRRHGTTVEQEKIRITITPKFKARPVKDEK